MHIKKMLEKRERRRKNGEEKKEENLCVCMPVIGVVEVRKPVTKFIAPRN